MTSAEKRIFRCDFFTPTYISGLEALRKGDHLNDVVLNVQGRKFRCHKLVLAANSKYFLTMFTADVNERNSNEIRMPPEIAPEAMETVLDYFYSGELALSESNIGLVFNATDYMRLDSLLEICVEYMQETPSLSNSVQRFVLAETIQYSSPRLDELKKACAALIVSGVEEISRREDFLNLTKKHISQILNYNNQPTMAESLYWVILKWVSYDEETRKLFLCDLLQKLPVEGISYKFLTSKMRNEKLVRGDSKSILWVMDAMSRFATTSVIEIQPSSFLFADRHLIQKCYFLRKVDDLTPQALHDRPKIDCISAISYKKRIYLFCGKETRKPYQLDGPNESWVDCHFNLKFGRRSNAGCAVLGDALFVVGGHNWKNDLGLNSCMKFNFCSGQNHNLPDMHETRLLPGVAIYATSLYAAGGIGASNLIERFDPREGQWCVAGQWQNTKRFDASCATTVADCLYCCDLFSGKVGRFDFRINRSQQIYTLRATSESNWCWISCVENTLFGARGGQIFIYDGVADKWNNFCCPTNMTDPIIVPWV